MCGARPVIAVLGASNVVLGLPELIATVRGATGEAHDLLVAGGHGRSYGLRTRVLGRGLPSIRESGILEDLRRLAGDSDVVHLAVTDIGNDVAYGVPPGEILGWIEECLAARPPGATTSLGLPPTAVLSGRSDRALRLLRTAFFPSARGLPIDVLRARLAELERGLRGLAIEVDRLVEPAIEWYGWDPLHVRRRDRACAWCRHLGDDARPARPGAAERWARLARPARWSLFGLELGQRQPARVFADGSRLFLL
ncbi:MAG TPA: hypothetical protein VMT85_03910 [Thermoanaerobaculia bacterium]|nr:hypothetical protein [Thermoanaerobaculia bacterium]